MPGTETHDCTLSFLVSLSVFGRSGWNEGMSYGSPDHISFLKTMAGQEMFLMMG